MKGRRDQSATLSSRQRLVLDGCRNRGGTIPLNVCDEIFSSVVPPLQLLVLAGSNLVLIVLERPPMGLIELLGDSWPVRSRNRQEPYGRELALRHVIVGGKFDLVAGVIALRDGRSESASHLLLATFLWSGLGDTP